MCAVLATLTIEVTDHSTPGSRYGGPPDASFMSLTTSKWVWVLVLPMRPVMGLVMTEHTGGSIIH